MNAKFELLAEWPDGEPKLEEQPNELKSDQAHTGRGSDRIIFKLILTKLLSWFAMAIYQKRSLLKKGDSAKITSMYSKSSVDSLKVSKNFT